jgi:hypothetical protein
MPVAIRQKELNHFTVALVCDQRAKAAGGERAARCAVLASSRKTALVRRGNRRLLHRPRRQRAGAGLRVLRG